MVTSSMYKYLGEMWKKPLKSSLTEIIRQRAIVWRRGPAITRVKKPLRLDRARALGYKAKQGFVVVRVRVRRGGLRKLRPRAGRRQKAMGVLKHTPAKSLQQIAEERVARKYPNLKVLGSYWIWKDGKYKWFEVILVDPHHPVIKNDKKMVMMIGGRYLKAHLKGKL
ncbi:MAG: 50S ribosomal protein L15e [Candidatus Bathyarchaeota archaeon]